MRIGTFCFALVAGLSLVTSAARAQQPAGSATPAAPQRASVPVAVIDLGYILTNHPTMKEQIERIKAESEAVGQEFEKERQSILKTMEELREKFQEGTSDYAKMEAEIAARDTEFRLKVVRKNKEFEEKRAQIFMTVHAQLTHLLKYYCENMGTSVVLKVNREKPDLKRPQTIETAMMQEVFYHVDNPQIDVTNWVLSALKEQVKPTGNAPATNAAAVPAANSPQFK